MASNRTKSINRSMRLSDCTNTIYSRSNLGIDSSLSTNWSIENETLLSQNSDISVGNLGNAKSFIDKVKQTVNKSELSIYFPRGSLNGRLKRKKRETNVTFSKSPQSAEESPVTSTSVSKCDSPMKTPHSKRICNVDFTFGQSCLDSVSNCLDSVAINSDTFDKTEILKKQRKKLSVHFKCDSTTTPDQTNTNVSSNKQNGLDVSDMKLEDGNIENILNYNKVEQNIPSNTSTKSVILNDVNISKENKLNKKTESDLIVTNISVKEEGCDKVTVKEEPSQIDFENSNGEYIKQTDSCKLRNIKRKRKSLIFGLDVSLPSTGTDSLEHSNFDVLKNIESSHPLDEHCNQHATSIETLKDSVQNELSKTGINTTYTIETRDCSLSRAPMEEDPIMHNSRTQFNQTEDTSKLAQPIIPENLSPLSISLRQSDLICISKSVVNEYEGEINSVSEKAITTEKMDIQGSHSDKESCEITESHSSPLKEVNNKCSFNGVINTYKNPHTSPTTKDSVNSINTLETRDCSLRCASIEEDHILHNSRTQCNQSKSSSKLSLAQPIPPVNISPLSISLRQSDLISMSHSVVENEINTISETQTITDEIPILHNSRRQCNESKNSTKLSPIQSIPMVNLSSLSEIQSDLVRISNSVVDNCTKEINSVSEKTVTTNEVDLKRSHPYKECCVVSESDSSPLEEVNNRTFEAIIRSDPAQTLLTTKDSGITSMKDLSYKLVKSMCPLKVNENKSINNILPDNLNISKDCFKEKVNSKNETDTARIIENSDQNNIIDEYVNLVEPTLIKQSNAADVLIESNINDECKGVREKNNGMINNELDNNNKSKEEEINDLDEEITLKPTQITLPEPQLSEKQHNNRKSVTFANTARLKSDSQSGEITIPTTPVLKETRSRTSGVTHAVNSEFGLPMSVGDSTIPREGNDRTFDDAGNESKENKQECAEVNNVHNFICPEAPNIKRNSSNTEQKGSRKNSKETNSLKQRRTSDKTINELSYDTLADLSEIPIDKSIIKRKLIYHSTPKYSVIEKNLSSNQSTRRSLRLKKTCKDQIIQVSNSIFGTSSEVTTSKKTNELSTSYSYQQEIVSKRKNGSSKSNSVKNSKSQNSSYSQDLSSYPDSDKYYSSTDGNKASNEESSSYKFIPSKNMLTTLRHSNESSIYSQSFRSQPKKNVCFKDFSTHIEYSNETSFSPTQYSNTSHSYSFRNRSSVTSYSGEEMDNRSSVTSYRGEENSFQDRDDSSSKQEPTPLKSYSSRLPSISDINDSKKSVTRHNSSKEISEYSIATPLLKQIFPTQNQQKIIKKNSVKKQVSFKPLKNSVRYNYQNDKRFMIDERPYEPPTIKFPAKWVHPNLLKFICSKLIGNYGPLNSNTIALNIISHLCATVAAIDRLDNQNDIHDFTFTLTNFLSKYNICSNVLDYCMFIYRFTPQNFQKKILSLQNQLAFCKVGDPIIQSEINPVSTDYREECSFDSTS